MNAPCTPVCTRVIRRQRDGRGIVVVVMENRNEKKNPPNTSRAVMFLQEIPSTGVRGQADVSISRERLGSLGKG